MRPLIRFTYLSFELNALLDEGKFLEITEVQDSIENESIFDFLKEKFVGKIDLSLYREEDKKELMDFFKGLSNVVDARRKFGVEKNGISLLLAYCIEGIQQLKRLK